MSYDHWKTANPDDQWLGSRPQSGDEDEDGPTDFSMRKCYLGDGVYADVLHGTIILTTENGIEVTNTIYLEPEVMDRLRDYLKRTAGKESISSKVPGRI